MANHITITYCTGCKWLLRSAWIAQELLSTFETEINELSLCPGSGGVFDVHLNGKLIWSRTQTGRFPDIKELKQKVRDQVSPGRSLGHTDRSLGTD